MRACLFSLTPKRATQNFYCRLCQSRYLALAVRLTATVRYRHGAGAVHRHQWFRRQRLMCPPNKQPPRLHPLNSQVGGPSPRAVQVAIQSVMAAQTGKSRLDVLLIPAMALLSWTALAAKCALCRRVPTRPCYSCRTAIAGVEAINLAAYLPTKLLQRARRMPQAVRQANALFRRDDFPSPKDPINTKKAP
jgi:hypothetical protein